MHCMCVEVFHTERSAPQPPHSNVQYIISTIHTYISDVHVQDCLHSLLLYTVKTFLLDSLSIQHQQNIVALFLMPLFYTMLHTHTRARTYTLRLQLFNFRNVEKTCKICFSIKHNDDEEDETKTYFEFSNIYG